MVAPIIAIMILHLQTAKSYILTTLQPDMFEPYSQHSVEDSWDAIGTIFIGYPIAFFAMIIVVAWVKLEKELRSKFEILFSLYNRNVMIVMTFIAYINFFSPHGMGLLTIILFILVPATVNVLWNSLPEIQKERVRQIK